MIKLKLITKVANFIFKNKIYRRLVLICGDIILGQFAILLSIFLFFEKINLLTLNYFYPFSLFFIFISVPIYIFTGQYSSLTSYLGLQIFLKIFFRNLLGISILQVILKFYGLINPFSLLILIVINITFLNLGFRYAIRKILFLYSKNKKILRSKIAIYGAGNSGINLASNLNLTGGYELIAFFDEDSDLWRRNIGGVPILSPLMIENIKGKVDKVLISIRNLNRSKRNEIIRKFQKLEIDVLVIPSLNDVASGKTKIDDIKPLEISDLIVREEFTSNNEVLFTLIEDKVIFVTGAGGSIGSELCLQILKYNPKKLILLERSEINLYEIEQKILSKNINNVDIKFVLGCAMNQILIKKILEEENVQFVFHSAAYKHVPIVEKNPIQGIRNNVLSTKVLCEESRKAGVENFCLISTDKAVRPTNIMGASKRLAELIVQSYSQTIKNNDQNEKINCCFSMVRFGNVLNSSGSVVPRFRKQIREGGPLTITHPKINRFFMTISEAANLVLESIIYARGGDLFLLDMGKPILIKELALQMIKLSGLTIKDKENPNGDIEIVYTGLRPGEKLYEELLIDAEAHPTKNKHIYRAKERFLNSSNFEIQLKELEKNLESENLDRVLVLLSEIVPEWTCEIN